MARYTIKRILIMIPTLLLVSVVIFLVVNSIPGDPATTLLGAEKTGDPEIIRERLGLTGTITERLMAWLSDLIRGDLGDSYFQGGTVWAAVKDRIPVTLSLATVALLIAVIIGVPCGILASLKPNSPLDTSVVTVSLLGVCTPEFFLGLILMMTFAVKLKWFPTGGYVSMAEGGFGGWLESIFLPAFTYGFSQSAYFARLMRSSMLETLNQDFILTARAKGQRESVIVMKHAFRNALLPLVTGIGMVYTLLLGGAFITESLFRLPGMGQLIITSITKRDYPVVCGILVLLAAAILLINLLIDILYAFIDPRVRYGKK